jgi:hypothetical protein
MEYFSFLWFAMIPALWLSILPAGLLKSWHWLIAAPALWLVLVFLLRLPFRRAVLSHEWSTPDGRRTAAYWLGVKAYFEGYDLFADVPAAAVTIWERYLAYGAALRRAERATAELAVLWTGRYRPSQPRPPIRQVSSVPVYQPRSVAELTSPDAIRIGMITVLDDKVISPAGSWPRSATRWTVTHTRHDKLTLNLGVVIVFVGMCCLFPATLVIVPAMFARKRAGTVSVTASWLHSAFTTQLPYRGYEDYAAIGAAVTAATGHASSFPNG